jgi:hypothetical protein
MTPREQHAPDLLFTSCLESADRLTPDDLYEQIPGARAASIEDALRAAGSLPEPMAETLTLAAVALRWAVSCGFDPEVRGHALLVAELLAAEARRRDPQADVFAECALDEMDSGDDVSGVMFLREAADSLAWACAVLRIDPAVDGVGQLPAMCIAEAAGLIAAADRFTSFEAGRDA